MSNDRAVTNYDDYIHEPHNRNLDAIPGRYGLPFIGDSISFMKDPHKWAQQKYKEFGPVARCSLFGGRAIVVMGPDLIQQMFLDKGRDFSSKMGFMDRITKFFEGSLIMEDFEHHKHQRRIMQTAFKNDALKHYTSEVNAIYTKALNDWQQQDGQTIEFFQYIKKLLLTVAAEVFIGEKDGSDRIEKLNRAFVDCANGTLYAIPWALPGTALRKGLKGKDYLQAEFQQLVPKKRAGDSKDMLSYFCREKDENGEYYTDEEIANQTIFLLFAAHDTTTAAITHTIYYLARHPEMKEKLYQEFLSLGKTQLDYDDLNQLPYLQQVFFETQRIRPSTPVVPRRTIRDVQMGDVLVPAHTMVYTVPRFEHFMEEYWTEPQTFDPERFNDERKEHKQHPFLYHPFGGGAHKCIGMHFAQMEYKCFLYQFMMQFDFEAKHKKEPFMSSFPLPKPLDDMPIKLIRRSA
ncbi:MAG: cytochrome P450 [Pseudomonadales bacterium]|nr:cytochrome P450 [Pseudomonadales bacterium]